MAKVIDVGKRSKKIKNAKPKRDWNKVKEAVHKACRIAMFRIVEYVIVFFVVSISVVLIGGGVIPSLAYELSSSFGLTQSTNYYIALASWIMPLLFYTLLITAATFCVLSTFIKWLHKKFTKVIQKPYMTEKEIIV